MVATAMPGSGVDIFAGSGGAPEGVLAAAAMRCVNGQMQGRLLFEDEDQVARAREMDPSGDPRRKLGLYDMAKGDVLFSATGVTDGALLRGVRFAHGRAITHTIVMRSKSGTIRFIEGQHDFKTKTWTAR